MYKARAAHREGSGGGTRVRSPGGGEDRSSFNVTAGHGEGSGTRMTGAQQALHLSGTGTGNSKYSPRAISAFEYNGIIAPASNGPLMTTGINFGNMGANSKIANNHNRTPSSKHET